MASSELEAMDFWEEWRKFLEENYLWFLPLAATILSPLIGSSAGILYDYAKLKGWIK